MGGLKIFCSKLVCNNVLFMINQCKRGEYLRPCPKERVFLKILLPINEFKCQRFWIMMEVLGSNASHVKDYRNLGCGFTQILHIVAEVPTSIKPQHTLRGTHRSQIIYIQIRNSMIYGGQQRLYCHLWVVTEVKTTMTRQYAPCAQRVY